MNRRDAPIAILSTRRMTSLAGTVAEKLGAAQPGRYAHVAVETKQFPDGELKPKITESVRGKRVYLFHSLYPDVNASLIELLFINNAIELAMASQIILVLPYFPYTRQDRKDEPRVPISAAVIPQLIATCRLVRQVITIDMHVEQEVGFFAVSGIAVDHLGAYSLHADYLLKLFQKNFQNVVFLSPDFGSTTRIKRLVGKLGCKVSADHAPLQVGLLQKERTKDGKPKAIRYIGESLEGKDVIVYDDLIATGGTSCEAQSVIMEKGARQVVHMCTHGVFCGSAEERFSQLGARVITTGTIPRDVEYREKPWLTILPIENILYETILANETRDGSVSKLFE